VSSVYCEQKLLKSLDFSQSCSRNKKNGIVLTWPTRYNSFEIIKYDRPAHLSVLEDINAMPSSVAEFIQTLSSIPVPSIDSQPRLT